MAPRKVLAVIFLLSLFNSFLTPINAQNLSELDHNHDGTIDAKDVLLFVMGWQQRNLYAPTPTSVPTFTTTTTNTFTPTATPSQTSSLSPTPIPTPTQTSTITETNTATSTSSPSTTPSGTPTITQTSTSTSTPSNTPFSTSTATPIPTLGTWFPGIIGTLVTGLNTSFHEFDDAWYKERGIGLTRVFTDFGDNIVLDYRTGLLWIKDPAILGGVFGTSGFPRTLTWSEADAACEGLEWGGWLDWRLPTGEELTTLLNADIPSPGPTSYSSFTTEGFAYWSSTVDAGNQNRAWNIRFQYGMLRKDDKSDYKFVRPVRLLSNKSPDKTTSRYTLTTDGKCVLDNNTGLMWIRDLDDAGIALADNWSGSIQKCEEVNYAGFDDWRMPNRHEALSIIDYSRNPAAPDPIFGTQLARWTSTRDIGQESVNVWTIASGGLSSDVIGENDDGTQSLVRPVRNFIGF